MLILNTDRRLDGGLSGQNWAEALRCLAAWREVQDDPYLLHELRL